MSPAIGGIRTLLLIGGGVSLRQKARVEFRRLKGESSLLPASWVWVTVYGMIIRYLLQLLQYGHFLTLCLYFESLTCRLPTWF